MAQSTPPPYVGITGLYVEDPKHVDTNLAGYDGNASPGQLVVDTVTYDLYVGNSLGNLNLVGGGGGSTTWATLGDKDNASGPTAIALGQNAGASQGGNSIAIGSLAGNATQGANSIAIGASAGVTGQAANSIVINATGTTLNNTVQNTLVVKPVRYQPGPEAGNLPAGFFNMAYNPTTGEIIYWE